MSTPTPTRLIVKNTGDHIYADVTNIMKTASDYLIMATYNIGFIDKEGADSAMFSTLKSIKCPSRGIILPMQPYPKKDPVNELKHIQALITSGLAVIVNESNHAKFVVSEKTVYYGSANLSNKALYNNLEVAYIENKDPSDPLQMDFIKLFIREINGYNAPKGLSNTTLLANLQKKLNDLVLKHNPNISKIETTVNSYDQVKSIISSTIEKYFAILSFKDFETFYKKIIKVDAAHDKLVEFGSKKIIIPRNKQKGYSEQQIEKYNQLWALYKSKLDAVVLMLEKLPDPYDGRNRCKTSKKNDELLMALSQKLRNQYE